MERALHPELAKRIAHPDPASGRPHLAGMSALTTAWIDYLHLVKWNGRWLIVNVLWEMKPGRPFTPWR
jgi:Putative lumazine-binding